MANCPALWAACGLSEYVAPPKPPLTLAQLKASLIAENRAECNRRILAAWPLEKQINLVDGTYPPERAQECTDWKAAHIEAENAAANLINAAETIQAAQAVTVEWPQ